MLQANGTVLGYVNYNPDFTENLYYQLNGLTFGRFNIQRPNSTFGAKYSEFVQCDKPETWEFIGNYRLV